METLINLILKIGAFIAKWLSGFNKDIIYINCNKKYVDRRDVEKLIGLEGKKYIYINTPNELSSKRKKRHFNLMRFYLIRIQKSEKYNKQIYYSGFSSVPFTVYDGYCFNDNTNITFLENNKDTQEKYLINRSFFESECMSFNIDSIGSMNDVNVVINSSFNVNSELLPKRDTINVDLKMSEEKITNEYLQRVYSTCYKLFNDLQAKDVKNIHLYVAARQSVSFVIGTAIDKRHPNVICYEFEKNKYTWSVDIINGKVKENE